MPLHDAHGVPMSITHAPLVAAYDRALDRCMGHQRGALALISATLVEQPRFIAGHLMYAGLQLGLHDPRTIAAAARAIEAAGSCGVTPTPREQSLRMALRAWATSGLDAGNRQLDRHLVDHPRDLFAIQLAHRGDLMLGRTAMLRDRVARVRVAWDEGEPGHAWLLGMLAVGLAEGSDGAQAEAIGRRAVALQPRDAWAVQAVAQACLQSGRPDDGIAWLDGSGATSRAGNLLAVQLHGQRALLHLARDEGEAALAIWDEHLLPTPQSLPLDLAEASALLWRLALRGVDVGGRWQVLAAEWLQRGGWGRLPLIDLHAAMCFAAAGEGEASRMLAAACGTSASGPASAAVWREVVLPAQRACEAWVAGRYGRCADTLFRLLPVAQAVGGSQVQRELLLLTAQAAADRGGDRALAEALLAQACATRRLAARGATRSVRAGTGGCPGLSLRAA